MSTAHRTISKARSFDRAMARMSQTDQKRIREFIWEFDPEDGSLGTKFKPLKGALSPIWTARINDDMRMVFLKEDDSWTILHVDHHDAANRWGTRYKVTSTGERRIQLKQVDYTTEVRIEEVVEYIEQPLFRQHTESFLSTLGFPPESLEHIYALRTEDQLEAFCEHLVEPLNEILYALYLEELPMGEELQKWIEEQHRVTEYSIEQGMTTTVSPLDQSTLDRLVSSEDLPNWLLFLTAEQQQSIDAEVAKPLWIKGPAGSGKSVVGLHRSKRLAEQGEDVRLLTHSPKLKEQFERDLDILCNTPEVRQRITVQTINELLLDWGRIEVQKELFYAYSYDSRKQFSSFMKSNPLPLPELSNTWFLNEWNFIIEQSGCISWEDYRKLPRIGRNKALNTAEKWKVWNYIRSFRKERYNLDKPKVDLAHLSFLAMRYLNKNIVNLGHIIVDEVQDLNNAQLRVLNTLYRNGCPSLCLIGDQNQRILSAKLDLSHLGIETHTLYLQHCYRTTEHIRRYAERVLPYKRRVISPTLKMGTTVVEQPYTQSEEEVLGVLQQVRQWIQQGTNIEDVAIIGRSPRIRPLRTVIAETTDLSSLQCLTIHDAKGLEFNNVIMMGVDENYYPLQSALQDISGIDKADLYERERQILYVGLTRAREKLVVTWVGQPSPFLRN